MDLHEPRGPDGPALPLMRSTDRVRQVLRRAQIVLGLAAVVIAVLIGLAAADAAPRPTSAGVTTTVQAELLASSPTLDAAVVGAAVPATARWTSSDGTIRSGELWVDAGLARGSVVTAPMDAAGELVDQVLGTEAPWVTGLLAGVGTLLSCWGLLAGVCALWRSRLALRDSLDWAAGWAHVEPRWSGRTD